MNYDDTFVANEELLTVGQVAKLFGVTKATIVRWANANKLTTIRTLGGHRRFPKSEVLKAYEQSQGGS